MATEPPTTEPPSAGPPAARPPAAGPPAAEAPASWSRTDTRVLGALVLVAGIVRLWRLGIPDEQVFDEQFYAKDACYYATGLEEPCGLAGNIVEVHPPMAKWLIGAGIKVFGFNAFGSRIATVIAGVVIVAVAYLIARRLFDRTWVAAVAGLYATFDFLLFVHSRLAMLEIFLPMFLGLGFLCLLYDRDVRGRDGPRRPRRWRFLAGAAFGCAIATKWAAVPALPAAVLLALLWDVRRHRGTGSDHPWRQMLTRDGVSLVTGFAVIPAAIYVLSYVGRVQGDVLASPGDVTSWWSAFWSQQVFMWDYFMLPRQLHSYTSLAWTWLGGRSAYPYHFNGTGTTVGTVMAAGSPVMWIPVIPATIYALVRWIRARSSRIDVLVPLVAFAATYGLWLVPSLFGYENFFIYYLVPAIPFMGLLIAAALIPLARLQWGRIVASILVASWVGVFAFMYPVIASAQLPVGPWDARIDLYQLCPVPPATVERFTLAKFFDEACRAAP